jgi:tRNA dimethylallyltransferase
LTRRFARRQESWFGPDPRISWLDAGTPDLRDAAVARVRATISDNGGHG